MHRLFVALRPPPPIRAQLCGIMAGIHAARWQNDGQLHVTLRFLGELDSRRADDVAATLGTVHAAAPRVALAGVGRFERGGRTDTLWAGLRPHDRLAALQKKVDRALVHAGLPAETRAYLPHITLARFARGAGAEAAIDAFLVAHAALTSTPFTMAELILYESHLRPDGADYTPVLRWPLAAPAD